MKILKIILPLIILGSAIAAGKYLSETGPEAKKRPHVERLPVVEVMTLKYDRYTVTVEASGIVKAGKQSSLISEVSGRVVTTSDNFQEGAYIGKGATLLTIDKANYEIALSIAESDVAGNRALLAQLEAEEKSNKRSLQLAKSNLSLGKKEVGRLRQLFKRKLIARSVLDNEEQKVNQLEQQLQDLRGRLETFSSRKLATKAKLSASLSRKKKEQLNLDRTTIRAPYAGRVLEKNVDVGQFVTTGSLLGKIVATDYVDVMLPLSLNRYDLLGISESSIGGLSTGALSNTNNKKPAVSFSRINTVSSQNAQGKQAQWTGKIVRTGVSLDADSRQITVIARIDKPFEKQLSPIRIGQYLKAKIKGKTYRDIFIVPPIAVRQNKEILLLEDGRIEVIPVEVIWNNPKQTIVKSTKNIADKQLIITALSQAVTGMKALTVEEQRKKDAVRNAKKKAARYKEKETKRKTENEEKNKAKNKTEKDKPQTKAVK